MKTTILTFSLLAFASILFAKGDSIKLQDCPKAIQKQLRADVRRAFLNVTFTAKTQEEEVQKIDAILAKAFGGAYLTFDPDEKDNEYQVHVSDGAGDAKKSYSFLYNQSGKKWILEARLEGLFPVGSPTKHDGWRDIVTQEHIAGTPPDHTLMRTYRHTRDGYVKIKEVTESGG